MGTDRQERDRKEIHRDKDRDLDSNRGKNMKRDSRTGTKMDRNRRNMTQTGINREIGKLTVTGIERHQ